MYSEVIRNHLTHIADAIAESVQQGKALLKYSAQIVQTNLQIFQAVIRLEARFLTLPPQIQRQQPVYLVDASNRECPFHLEFIRSAEALLSVLKVNLKGSGCGPGMIDRGWFVIEDAGTQAPVDLTQNWDTCFYPGQRVAMSMIFGKKKINGDCCPQCGAPHSEATVKEVTCVICGIVFRQMEYLDHRASQSSHLVNRHEDTFGLFSYYELLALQAEVRKFRRIRVINLVRYEALARTTITSWSVAAFSATSPTLSAFLAPCLMSVSSAGWLI
ncbi:hypothetical protein BJX68DRAFT_191934 [Aspergillus pseudodeflectus]|uniref:Ubiquitin-like domain-containing protein n=1 Tax=Aspergillus pseudodeflectus TaxID=176178 RepID=A0ABR4KWZ4_9EURO